jgi:tetratricopeptide (TPR) repeat protein
MNRAERRRQEKRQRAEGLPKAPAPSKDLFEAAFAHHRAGRWMQAEPLYRQMLRSHPDHPGTLHYLGLLAYQTGRLDEAGSLLERAALRDPKQPAVHFNAGVVFQKQGRLAEAAAAYRQALALNSQYVEALANLGTVHLERTQWTDAVAIFERAVRLNPAYADAHNNLGAALKELGELDRAAAAYAQALRIVPDHLEARCNLGLALMEQGKLEEAAVSCERALQRKSDYAKAHYTLGFIRLRQRRVEEAVASFRRSASVKHDHGRPVREQAVFRSRIKHDAQQIRYLLDRGVLDERARPYLDALTDLRRQLAQAPGSTNRTPVGADAMRAIAPSFNRILHYADCPALPGGALNPALDVAAIEARYCGSRPEIMSVDDLLRPEALAALRRFCLESTIWKKDYENGYVGAFLGDGFACPLLLQLAEELRAGFPGIFKGHQLLQSWAFKCDSEMKALNMHADAAAVNVNFWITPDEANLDPAGGGLIVWDKEAPAEWNFKEYNDSRNEPKVREFLRRSGARAVAVPYRQNRALVFNSDLFHESGTIRFKDDYESRRINITLLYGRRGT